MSNAAAESSIQLPPPATEGRVSVEKALMARRSVRRFEPQQLSLQAVGQVLFAAQGVTHPGGYRTAPSAGASYPLETYLLAGHVQNLPPGVYKYKPKSHALHSWIAEDRRDALMRAALNQGVVANAPAIIVLSVVWRRIARRYGDRSLQYVYMEAGHVGQNVSLQAVALGLGSVMIGAFADTSVKEAAGLLPDETPLYIMPFGKFGDPVNHLSDDSDSQTQLGWFDYA